MTSVQLELAREMRELAALMAANGWSRLQGVRLKFLASQVVKECQRSNWPEAAGRADALSDLLSGFIQDAPSEARLTPVLRATTRLAGQLEAGQLADKVDADMLPAVPEDWLFVFAGEASDEFGDLVQNLNTLGFNVMRSADVDAAAGCWRMGRTIVLAAASWLIDNGERIAEQLPVAADSLPISSLLVALDDTNDFRAQIEVRRIGARLLLDLRPDAAHLIAELAGLAWMPRVPYRVMLIGEEIHAELLRETGFDVLAIDDPVTFNDSMARFDPEACVFRATSLKTSPCHQKLG